MNKKAYCSECLKRCGIKNPEKLKEANKK